MKAVHILWFFSCDFNEAIIALSLFSQLASSDGASQSHPSVLETVTWILLSLNISWLFKGIFMDQEIAQISVSKRFQTSRKK